MKTITLHLTFSAAVLEILGSLSQLEEKDFPKTQIHTDPKVEARRVCREKTRERTQEMPGKNAHPVGRRG